MQVMIRYKVRADEVDRSMDLLRAVYEDLGELRPNGLRYETFQLPDKVSFMAFVQSDDDPVAAPYHRLASFQRYRAALSEICVEGPSVTPLDEAGRYSSR